MVQVQVTYFGRKCEVICERCRINGAEKKGLLK